MRNPAANITDYGFNQLIDYAVERKLSRDRFGKLSEIVEECPVVPKYDPEDFQPDMSQIVEDEKVAEMANILGHPSVGVVQLGGTYDVGPENMKKTIELLNRAQKKSGTEVFKMLEPGSPTDLQNDDGGFDQTILDAADVINKPYVWNTKDSTWKDGMHSEAQIKLNKLTQQVAEEELCNEVEETLASALPKKVEQLIEPDSRAKSYIDQIDPVSKMRKGFDSRIIPETYFVVNRDAAVAEKTGADEWLKQLDRSLSEEAAAMTADRVQDGYRGIIYIEASGTLGPEEVVSGVRDRVPEDYDSLLIGYGGGIRSSNDIETYLDAGADFVFVGNSIQKNGAEALR